LTAQEIEMIKLKREQEENAAKQKAVAQQILRDKYIEKEKSNIEKFIELQKRKNEWAKTSVVKFNSMNTGGDQYELIKVDRDKVFECYEHRYHSDGTNTKDIYFSEIVKYVDITIHPKRLIGTYYDINITDDMNFNYNYKIYKTYKTLNEKIMTKIRSIDYELVKSSNLESAVKSVKEILQVKYPEATLVYDKEYMRAINKYSPSYYSHSYVVTFPNGLRVQFGFREDGIISNGIIKNMSDFNVDSVIDFCRVLDKKQTNK
jgi:hypothetical protein